MQFDNRNNTLKLNIRRYLVLLIFASLLGVFIFTGALEHPFWGIGKTEGIVLVVVLYALYLVVTYFINYNYLYYSDEGSKIILRFVSLRPFNSKRNAIEIPKKYYNGYIIKKSLFNLKEEIIFSIHTQKGIAKYPPISITGLTVKQKNLLKRSLNQI
ncbi:MAG: hypothetical protein R6V23_16385 [Bacteroidales bacterium]